MKFQAIARISLMILASHIQSLMGQQQTDEFSPAFLRVPMQIDEEILPTSLLLEIPHQPVQAQLAGFEQGQSGLAEQAFAKLMGAFTAGDVSQAAGYYKAVPFSEGNGQEMANLFIDGFKGVWPSLRMIRKYDLGQELIVSWYVHIEGQDFCRVTRISKDPQSLAQGQFWIEDMGQGMTNLQNVIAEAEQAIGDGEAELLTAAEAGERTHRTEVPGTKGWWNFNGTSASFEAFEKAPQDMLDNPAAKVFHQAMQALSSGDAKAYSNFFTAFSQQRFLEWQGQLPNGGYEAYVSDMQSEGRQVVFVMDADPAFLVFYETKDGRFPYQVLYRQADDSLKLANFYVEGIFDGMLKDEDFFFNPVLKPLFGKGPEKVVEPTPQVPADKAGALPRASGSPSSNSGGKADADSSASSGAGQEGSNGSGGVVQKKPLDSQTRNKWTPIIIGVLILLGVIALLALLKKFK